MSTAYTDAIDFGKNVTIQKSKSISVASGDTEFYIDPVSRRLSARWNIDPLHAKTLYMTYGCDPDGYRTDRFYASGKNLYLYCGSVQASIDSDIGPLCIWLEQTYGESYLDSINWHVHQQDIEYDVKLAFTPWFSLRRSIRRVRTDELGVKQSDGGQCDEWWLSFSIPGEGYGYFSEVQQRPAVGEADNHND